MILPNNGKVVVFDDKIADVTQLLTILSQEKIPYLYYHDELAGDLPSSPIDNVRLVFLDLELVINSPNTKNLIGPIAQRLKSTLTKNNPYILIYWSTKENQYKDVLEKEFETGLKEYKPIKILSLNKAEANDKGSDYIKAALEAEMKEFSSLNAFMLWESAVNNSAGLITNHITSIFEKNEKWDKNMYDLLFRLAKAQAGRDTMPALNNTERLEIAFEIFNSNLVETIEKKFGEISGSISLEEIKEGGAGMSAEEKVKLNTKLHLIHSKTLKHFVAGNLYIEEMNATGREIIQRNFKDAKITELKKTTPKLICLDLTPTCDYSQGKNYSRMVYGVMVDSAFTKSDLKPGDYRYQMCPPMLFDLASYIIFDFRCLRSFSKDEFLFKFKKAPQHRLRSNILLDIQAQLSNHINRPGIVTVD